MKSVLSPALFDFGPRLWVQHCAEGPLPKGSVQAATAFLQKELHPWDMRLTEDFVGIPTALRKELALLIGAESHDITLTQSTSTGLSLVAHSFPWAQGDEVLAPLGEFPSNAWPWKSLALRGVSFREVPLWDGHMSGAHAWNSTPPGKDADPEARIIDAISEKTKIVALSWVRFQDGLKLDCARIGEACRQRGIDLVIDGIQGMGTHHVDLTNASAFVSGGHKGMLGPSGQGFLWTDPKFRERLVPAGSWLSVEDWGNFSRASTDLDRRWADDGTRLEQGNYNLLGSSALLHSARLLFAVSIQAIEAHVSALQREFLDRLVADPEWRVEAQRLSALHSLQRLGPIICLHHGDKGQGFLQDMLQEGFRQDIFASVREGYLRIALHGWHSGKDIERLIAWVCGEREVA